MCPLPAPVKLRPDNFTPPTRTPWGGKHIRGHYKRDLGLADGAEVVGESWEVSVEPSFPSSTSDGTTLAALIASAPESWLGPAGGAQTPLLVKLLDAADNLSVQVHPADGDAALAADESGKPESWIVLRADPGAGLYLGFREGVERHHVEACIADCGALDELMTFVPVAPGDSFMIAAGTPHAIGAGVTLLEPQYVRPGKRGITYRFWDWNRRYDPQGKLDPAGAPRALHLQRSIEVTGWHDPRGEAFVAGCRAETQLLQGGALSRERVLDWPWFQVEAWRGSGHIEVPPAGVLQALTCVQGRIALRCTPSHGAGGELALRAGESGVVPAGCGALGVSADDALCYAVMARQPGG